MTHNYIPSASSADTWWGHPVYPTTIFVRCYNYIDCVAPDQPAYPYGMTWELQYLLKCQCDPILKFNGQCSCQTTHVTTQMNRQIWSYTVRIWHINQHESISLFIGCSVAPTPWGSYDDFQLLLVEDLTCTNIKIFACICRTTDTPQVSWKTSTHESFCPDHDSNPWKNRKADSVARWSGNTLSTYGTLLYRVRVKIWHSNVMQITK